MASKVRFVVHAMRSNGTAYARCEPHRATSWAVVKETITRRDGREYGHYKTVSRHTTAGAAQGEADSRNKGYLKPERDYKLGRRMPPKI